MEANNMTMARRRYVRKLLDLFEYMLTEEQPNRVYVKQEINTILDMYYVYFGEDEK